MGDFLSFRKMIVPSVIQVLFWIGLVVVVLIGVGLIIAGLFAATDNAKLFFIGLVYLLLGPLGVRIYCELIIIMFKIHESLEEIRKNTSRP